MEKRNFCGEDISLLGFGLMRLPKVAPGSQEIDYEASSKLVDYAIEHGVNYFDTAHTYVGSEEFAGHALSKYPRESYYIATKCPPWKLKSPEDFESIFEGQLKKLKTDYIDYYLVHNFAEELKRAEGNELHFEHFEKIKMYDILKQKKAEGKIRHIGFSFHGTPALLEKVVEKYEWDFAQIQLNYVDWTATDAKQQYEILSSHNIPITIMEPLRGGTLSTLSESSAKILTDANPNVSLSNWGLRYATSLPGIKVALSGMNEMYQLEDNLATMKNYQPVSDEERAILYKAASEYSKSGAVPCTGCEYCIPCPVGVKIPRIFAIYNYYKLVNFRIPFDNGYSTLAENEKASACVNCGKCVEQCPQHLAIPDYLEEIAEFANSPA